MITICRGESTTLRATAERDFFEILRSEGLYSDKNHSKSNREYILFGNTVEFIGLDKSQKVRGRGRDVLFINEANEVDYETFVQLNIRTTTKVFIDYNPSEEFWVEDLKQRSDAKFFITTYKDNPFLGELQKEAIEQLKNQDPALYQIYALGMFAELQGLIYSNRAVATAFPIDAKKVAYGLDFGFTNDPTTLIKCGVWSGEVYAEELIYETGLTNLDLGGRLKELNIPRNALIIADTGGGGTMNIEEIKRMGWNIVGAKKGPGSIKFGIDVLQRYKLNLIGSNLVKEGKNYVWRKDNTGKSLGEPVDRWNHGLDALRYWASEKLSVQAPAPPPRRHIGSF
jgi:phage terminase large subunit